MRNLAIKDEQTDVVFYFEEEYQTILAYFPSEINSNKMSSCYVRHEGHSECASDYVAKLRKATPDEYAETLADLTDIYGYNLNIL